MPGSTIVLPFYNPGFRQAGEYNPGATLQFSFCMALLKGKYSSAPTSIHSTTQAMGTWGAI